MDCPVDGSELRIADRSGVEIDYCPKCRGVWLDRGELDKIIDRAAVPAGSPPVSRQGREGDFERGYDQRSDHGHGYKHRKRRGLLGDLFDFD